MTDAVIIFPHQLFQRHPGVKQGRTIFLVEENLYFNQYNFHKQKLVLHRSSMKSYQQFLAKDFQVNYIEAKDKEADIRELIKFLSDQNVTKIHYVDTVDDWLEKRIEKSCLKYHIERTRYQTPGFLNSLEGVAEYFDKKKSYYQTDFYVAQRKQRLILVEKNLAPIGGKWSFDSENRKRFPKKQESPLINYPSESEVVREAITYIQHNFPGNYGELDSFSYPIDFEQSNKWLDDFLETRFCNFGTYEDAMVKNESILFHSRLTPMLNIGLLEPQDIVDKAIQAGIQYDVPLNSIEGFIRQIIGWREFIRIVYEREGHNQRTRNYWGFKRNIPESFWKGTTGIHPIDLTIKKVLKTGYCHHIERLMILGNFMLLCEFDPDQVYQWFMELFIDSYDWVMVPNVYGMTQFADGGLMTTKPYISGSNYLLKMGDWDKGPWQQTWDGLFWRFMDVHRDFFLQNPRLGMLVSMFDKMPKQKRHDHLSRAATFLGAFE